MGSVVSIPAEIQRSMESSYGVGFITDIDARDEMYQFLRSHPAISDPVDEYFRSGESMMACLEDVYGRMGHHLDKVDSFLDFACGYGRLIRFLVHHIRPERITVSDIDRPAVEFCVGTFGVKGVVSARHPEDLHHDRNYDLIWAASLFSHLSHRSWDRWLARLHDMLNEGATLIFSTHGMHCYDLLNKEAKAIAKEIQSGFYFIGSSETKRLSPADYGTTYVSHDYVQEVLQRLGVGGLMAFYPHRLWDFQDVYVINRA